MDQVGLARMVIAHLEIRPSGIRPSVSKPAWRGEGGGGHCMGKGRHNIEKGIHGIGDMGSLH